MSEAQTYQNHRRFVPMWHYILPLVLLAILIGAVVNLLGADASSLYSASLILALIVALIPIWLFERTFALKAQDRAIRAEENLRHFARTGKLLDSRLTLRQIIALRFASDEEYDALAARATSEGLSEDDIKKAITAWRADHDRA